MQVFSFRIIVTNSEHTHCKIIFKMDKKSVEKIYESENFLVVNKPFDMYINSDDENEKNTVTYHIASPDSHLSSSANPLHFVQRLDYSTSGVLCIAKTKSAAAKAGRLFEKRETRKYYLAIVRGHIEYEVADIEYDVGVDPLTEESSHRMVARTSSASGECGQPRGAHTRLLVLELGWYNQHPVTVVLLKPITGRRHQLRVHCAAVSHTILGDYTYSYRRDKSPHRMFLHAARLVVLVSGEPLDIITPEPFFQDPQFSTIWKSERVVCKYKNKEDFVDACDMLDEYVFKHKLVLPVPSEPLDIQTPEPFFQDPQFSTKWKSERVFYKYKSKEDFIAACEILDKSYVIGVKYKAFTCSD